MNKEETLQIPRPDGFIPALAVEPEGLDSTAAVIILMDAPGIREELRDFARRIARSGYLCLLPDMFHRLGALRFDS